MEEVNSFCIALCFTRSHFNLNQFTVCWNVWCSVRKGHQTNGVLGADVLRPPLVMPLKEEQKRGALNQDWGPLHDQNLL